MARRVRQGSPIRFFPNVAGTPALGFEWTDGVSMFVRRDASLFEVEVARRTDKFGPVGGPLQAAAEDLVRHTRWIRDADHQPRDERPPTRSLTFFRNMADALRRRRWRRTYQEGSTISRFIARNIRRDVEVASTARIDEGVIVARVRNTNVLCRYKGFIDEPTFSEASGFDLDVLWHWMGASWGGLPDGRSIAARLPAAAMVTDEA